MEVEIDVEGEGESKDRISTPHIFVFRSASVGKQGQCTSGACTAQRTYYANEQHTTYVPDDSTIFLENVPRLPCILSVILTVSLESLKRLLLQELHSRGF